MNMRGLPGTLAPMYQLLACGSIVGVTASVECRHQAASASSLASMLVCWRCFSATRQSAIHSTCCSMELIMLVSTDGLPGPVIVNRFGKPATIRPR